MDSSWFVRETRDKVELVNTNSESIEFFNKKYVEKEKDENNLWLIKNQEEILDINKRRGIDTLSISKEANCKEIDVSFINSLSVSSLFISNADFFRITSDLSISTIKEIVVGKIGGVLDLTGFPFGIHLYVIKWHKKFSVKEAGRVSSLMIRSYNPSDDKTFGQLSDFINVFDLDLALTSIERLDGIEKLSNLEKFKLERATKLSDIGAIGKLSYLTSVAISTCRKIELYNPLSEPKRLKRIVIVKSAPIPSLNIFKNQELNELYVLQNKILDGDRSLLSSMEI